MPQVKPKSKNLVKFDHALEELRAKNSKGFLLQHEVIALVRLSRIEIWRRYQRGEFPIPRRQGNRSLVWKASEIFAWMDNLPLATKSPIKFGGHR